MNFLWSCLLITRPAGSRVEFSTTVFCFWLLSRAGAHASCHGVPEIEMKDDLNFSAMVHSNKQISRQISTIVF